MALYIGLMSGTSMDGIDVALVDMPANELVHANTQKYSKDVDARLQKLLQKQEITLASICQLNTLIGNEFAGAVNKLLLEAKVSAENIVAIGSHGQTVCHDALAEIPYTLQLGCPHSISSHTGITVVADFRTRDIVNGGQGAPFAPLYHQELFSSLGSNIAAVNIGGIANVSFLSTKHSTRGWDVGPGNCLMDAWITKHRGNFYDSEGLWASQGQLIPELLDSLLSDPFLSLAPPKSIGKEYFSLAWLSNYLKSDYQPVDVMHTLMSLTAHAIANAIKNQNTPIEQLILCGGGTHNLALKLKISQLIPDAEVKSSAELGVSPDHIEAMMFAWLAYRTINIIPVNLASITGSKGEALLGAIYPRGGV